MKMANAGRKVLQNTVSHYAQRGMGRSLKKETLHERNASSLYRELGEMKGSVLKMAQMLSQDQSVLPEAYQKQFKMAQYSAPPLSYPLVDKVFKSEFGSSPEDLYDSFEREASHAASIGQVHVAYFNGQKVAVKVQYPGIGRSISSDLKLARPFAASFMGLNKAEIDHYFSEVENKMLEETDYDLERRQAQDCKSMLSHYLDVQFPQIFEERSSSKIITMEYLEGLPLDQYANSGASFEDRNRIGHLLWKIYDEQIRQHHYVHADPHPGNFQVAGDGRLQMLDFGCMKRIPISFSEPFFELMDPKVHDDPQALEERLFRLEFLKPEDSGEEKVFFKEAYKNFIMLLGRPFFMDHFDFSDVTYFQEIVDQSEALRNSSIYQKTTKGRGLKDGLYVHRTYFGLYHLMHLLGARIGSFE